MQKANSFKHTDQKQVEWLVSSDLISYEDALSSMQARVQKIQDAQAPEQVWSLEHPPLYTLGTSAKKSDVLEHHLPTYKTGRGGQVTYHGPGQRVIYLMLDLQQRCLDLKAYVWTLEEWLIRTIQEFGITAVRREGRIGLWVPQSPTREDKIAAIGVRIQKWVTSHGVAINIHPDLNHFNGIIPCGIKGQGVTSLQALGIKASLPEVDEILRQKFKELF